MKLLMADGRMTQERICLMIKNPKSGKPISVETLVKCFAHELETGREEVMAMMSTTLIDQAKKGSLGHLIWFEKTRLGVRDPSYDKLATAKTDAAGADVKHEVEIVGGLPTGSTPEKPEGDNYSDIPPEESHG